MRRSPIILLLLVLILGACEAGENDADNSAGSGVNPEGTFPASLFPTMPPRAIKPSIPTVASRPKMPPLPTVPPSSWVPSVPTLAPLPTREPSPLSRIPSIQVPDPASWNATTEPTSTTELPTPTPEPTATPDPFAGMSLVSVSRVIDGDTIEVDYEGHLWSVRLIGIDTPETVHPTQPVQCFGTEASAFTTQMIELSGWHVYLEKDVSETDRYDRLLRYVWLAHADGNRMLNQELVSQGFAQVSTYPPDVRYQGLFLDVQRTAVDENRGLWGECGDFGVALATPTPIPQPTATPEPAPVQTGGVEFITVRGAAPWGTAFVEVLTAPGATCSIGYVTPAGTQSQAQGLVVRTADGSGYVSWSWSIGSRTRPGTGSVTVTCDGVSARSSIVIG